MLIKRTPEIPSSDITPESLYRNRRAFLKTAALATAGAAAAFSLPNIPPVREPQDPSYKRPPAGPFNTDEDLTPYKDVTTYNNFYE
ncbi:MAG: twin-arginine translocation signal domain-containing protein, partial [Ignavibacteriales bacterium]|nr:twin-arginine translocation signal domain-containing protein [Ignavibacteriales bacterium]